VGDVRQSEIHIPGSLVAQQVYFEAEIPIEKLKRYDISINDMSMNNVT
jgi:hypothetical protein